MILFEYQSMSPIGKKNVSLILRFELREEGPEILLFRGVVPLPVNDHGGNGNLQRVQDRKLRIVNSFCLFKDKAS